MKRGLFITLEGPDGSGKSTQIEFLKAYFQERNLPCVFTREPGGTAIGEKLRNIILDKENQEMCDMAEALLYAAARAQHVQQLIRPALEAGKIVLLIPALLIRVMGETWVMWYVSSMNLLLTGVCPM